MSKPEQFNRSARSMFKIQSSRVRWTGYVCLLALAPLFLLAIGLGTPYAVAQQAGVALTGTVTDPSGAVVPGAQVTVQGVQTGLRRTTQTDAHGHYAISNLEIGEYQVQVTKTAFQTEIQKGLKLEVGGQPVVDIKLQIGSSSETVTVEAASIGVKISSTEMSSLVDEREVHELPLNGRNFEQLILLAPGAQPVGASTQNAVYGRNIAYSISGSRPSDQSILLDGQDIQGFWGHGAGNPMTGNALGVEAIAEYQTITSTYGAQYGGSGSVINAATKAGTNTFHGSLYDFVRNRVFDASNRFDNPLYPTSYRRNQFGGSVGGPLRKDRDFFFANYEGFRQALGTSIINTVPDANGHNGLIGATQYVVSPVIAPYLALYPACTPGLTDFAATSTCQFLNVNTTATNEDYGNVKVDHHISDKDSLFVRYVYDSGTYNNPLANTIVPGWPEIDKGGAQFVSIGETRIFTPSLINVANLSFSRPSASSTAPGRNPLLQFVSSVSQNGNIGVTGIAGLGSGGSTSPISYLQNKYAITDNATWVRGHHELKVGMEIRRQESNFSFPNSAGGAYSFTGLAAFVQNKPTSYRGVAANAYLPERGMRELQLFPYVQDSWKLTSRLVLNLGLRYEFVTNPTEVHNLVSAIVNPATDINFTYVPNAMISNPAARNIDPRAGFALDVFGNHKTALRGAFGIYHIIIEPREYNNNYSNSLPLIPVSQQNPVFPVASGSAGLPVVNFGMDYRTKVTPYLMQYNLDVERQLPVNTILTVAYVGSVGRHLFITQNLNPPVGTFANGSWTIANPTTNGNTALSFVALARPIASSNYNSLQVNLKRSSRRGLDAQLAYTFSKFLDNGSVSGSGFEGQANNAGVGSNPYTIQPDYSRSSFDVTHNAVGNLLYQLPFRGNKLADGWQVSAIGSLHTGFPFSVRTGVSEADQNYSQGQERVNLVPGFSNNPLLRQNVAGGVQWYNPAAFSEPAPGTFGNLGRNTLTGPGTVDFDFGTQKTTRISSVCEACSVQLKADLFNIFNHPNLGLPPGAAFSSRSSIVAGNLVQGAANALAPVISSTNTTSRQIQFAVRFLF